MWKYGHVVAECYHRFYETFTPPHAQSNLTEFPRTSTDKQEVLTLDSKTIVIMRHTHEYYLLEELEKQIWFANSGSYHHLTHYAQFLHIKKQYAGHSRVCVSNGKPLTIHCVDSSCVIPKNNHICPIILSDIFYVPYITRNLLLVSKCYV